MTTEPRRRYAGHGIARIPGPGRAAVSLPGPDEATVLPDPRAARQRIFDSFLDANGPVSGRSPEHPFPRLAARDVLVIANHLTFALRNDLPSIDAHDAAVIWEKWRVAVRDLRDLLRGIELEQDVPMAAVILDHRTFDVHESLATALSSPGTVFDRYCPWRADWATPARIHPEGS